MENTKKQIQLIKTFVAGLLVSATLCAVIQPAAMAVISDPVAFSRLQQQKSDLLVRETTLLRSKDDLNKKIDDLRRIDDGSLAGQLNDLSQSLNRTYADLRQVQFDIRDLNRRMM